MAKMTILRGVSGSGKSTWARQQNAIVVSRDSIRVMLFGDDGPEYYKVDKDILRERENAVTIVQNAMIESSLRAGLDVVVDNTNTEWKFVKALAKIGNRLGAGVEIKTFDVGLHEAINRDALRGAQGGRYVGEAVIRRQWQRLQGSKDNTLEPGFVPAPYEGTPGKPKAFMFDLDGTTFHMNGKRSPYAHNVDVDDPDEVVLNIVRIMQNSGMHAVAMSGREEATRDLTLNALDENGVNPDALFMRSNKDMRKDSIIKAELFDTCVRDNWDVQFVLDDRNQVVEMWRSMGLTCLQVAPGDF